MSKTKNESYVEFMNKVFSISTEQQRNTILKRLKTAHEQLKEDEK